MQPHLSITLPSAPSFTYPIWIGSGLVAKVSTWLPQPKSQVVVITDNQVKKQHAGRLESALHQAGYQVLLLGFPAGEKSKQIRTKMKLEENMLRHGCDRDTLIIALGGGVVGDMAGFIAATYMRGIAYIHMPTTLLAMVDSAIGGKTGINTPLGKNLIGAFWQPSAVIVDLQHLQTLSKKQLINGLFEAIKVFLTCDAASLYFLKKNLTLILKRDGAVLTHLVQRAVAMKAAVVVQDEKEHHQRAILNFGHTIGHALEQISHFKLPHGYAVAYGMLVEAKIAEIRGLLSPDAFIFIRTLLQQLTIQGCALRKFAWEDVIKSTRLDKKNKAGSARYVLLTALGQIYQKDNQMSHPVSDEIVMQAWTDVMKD